jgi:hypothetical protein
MVCVIRRFDVMLVERRINVGIVLYRVFFSLSKFCHLD